MTARERALLATAYAGSACVALAVLLIIVRGTFWLLRCLIGSY